MVNDTARLLGLDGLVVVTVEDETDKEGPVVHQATADEQARGCPQCATRAGGSSSGVTTRLRDLPVGKLGTDLRTVWNVKEDLLDLLALARTGPERAPGRRPAQPVYRRCASSSCRSWRG